MDQIEAADAAIRRVESNPTCSRYEDLRPRLLAVERKFKETEDAILDQKAISEQIAFLDQQHWLRNVNKLIPLGVIPEHVVDGDDL